MVTKETIAEEIAKKHNLSKAESHRIVNDVFDIVAEEVKNDGKVFISGFGTFTVSNRKERACVNPQTKEKMKVEARKVPHFSAAKNFKESLN